MGRSAWGRGRQTTRARQEKRKEEGGDSLFVRLDDGDQVELVFIGDPMESYQKWNGHRYERMNGPGRGVSIRFLCNVYDVAQTRMRIISMNEDTFLDVADEMEDADGDMVRIRITRRGSDTDTRYRVKALGPVDDDLDNDIQQEEEHDLAAFGGVPIPGVGSSEGGSDVEAKKADKSRKRERKNKRMNDEALDGAADDDIPF